MDSPSIRRRNTLKDHYTMTSNVIIFGYSQLTDSEKLTYQAIDSFDWSDRGGKRKGYAYPSLATLARLRGVDERTLRRHLASLERVGLLKRQLRAGQTSLLWIEEPSAEESERYLSTITTGPDTNVRGTPDTDVRPILESEEKKQTKPLTPARAFERGRGGKRWLSAEQRAKRDWLAEEILNVTKDPHSLGFYRSVAASVPEHRVFQRLSELRDVIRRGDLKATRGAFFTATMKGGEFIRNDP